MLHLSTLQRASIYVKNKSRLVTPDIISGIKTYKFIFKYMKFDQFWAILWCKKTD